MKRCIWIVAMVVMSLLIGTASAQRKDAKKVSAEAARGKYLVANRRL